MLWDSTVDELDNSELTEPAFVNFVRDRVAKWFEWSAKETERLELLVEKYGLSGFRGLRCRALFR